MHRAEHHLVGPHSQILVVKEAAHVGISGHCSLLHLRESVVEIFRNHHDALHLPLLQKLFRLGHFRARECDGELPRGVKVPDELP